MHMHMHMLTHMHMHMHMRSRLGRGRVYRTPFSTRTRGADVRCWLFLSRIFFSETGENVVVYIRVSGK